MLSSFSAGVKEEICKYFPQKQCCALAQCYGILLFCNCFSENQIRIITESQAFGGILPKLFLKAFDMNFDRVPSQNAGSKLVFSITDTQKISQIFHCYGFSSEGSLSLHVNLGNLEDDCCRAAFLRGAFLAGGSVTDPIKGYHFEMGTIHRYVARECDSLIRDVLGFAPKTAERGGNQVLYLKQSDSISDFLTFLGAPVSAMGIMEARLEKELNNKVNRRCNCDDANISKVVDAAQEQLSAIKKLRSMGKLESLPQKLMQAVRARESNPASSLSDLAALMEPPISKPAMNHRLKKIVAMAQEAES